MTSSFEKKIFKNKKLSKKILEIVKITKTTILPTRFRRATRWTIYIGSPIHDADGQGEKLRMKMFMVSLMETTLMKKLAKMI